MKISRIALASLISFGVFGGAGLNASASHHRGYHKVLWNKPMAHKQVALKNGKGIIWNKPFKTAKNAKIKYRISHGKSLALTTLRHMKVKGGSIYYFVKAGKFSGWINKKSVKLVKKTTVKTVTEPTHTTTPAPTTQAPQTTNSSAAQASSATSSNNGSGTATGSVPEPYKTDGYGTVTKTEDGKLPVDYNNPFSTYAEGTLKGDTWVYHQRYNGKKVYDRKVGFALKKGAKVTVALSTPHSNRKTLLIKAETPDGTHYGYVKRSEVTFGHGQSDLKTAPKKSTTSDTTGTNDVSTPAPATSGTTGSVATANDTTTSHIPESKGSSLDSSALTSNPFHWGGPQEPTYTPVSNNPYRWDGTQAPANVWIDNGSASSKTTDKSQNAVNDSTPSKDNSIANIPHNWSETPTNTNTPSATSSSSHWG